MRDKVVVQAGGFTGDTALYYAEKGAKVYSFEPDPNSYKLALENIKLNPQLSNNIVMRNYALGEDEFIDFPASENGSGGNSAYDIKKNKTVRVRSVSITKILEEFHINIPYLLDLDIKGKEFEVINDSSLSKFRKVRVEYSPGLAMVANGRDILINRLKEYGFSSMRVFKHNQGSYDLHNHGTIECAKSQSTTNSIT
ncbi:MAG: FkbM family methyltransferase [Thermoplasmatales archaeon]